MKDVGDKPELEKELYQHYKGGVYEVLDVACHTESLEWLVVYESQERKKLGLPSIWVRPYVMFTDLIEVDGASVPRFLKLG